jgi:hypothetical protein
MKIITQAAKITQNAVLTLHFRSKLSIDRGPGNVVDIATGYGLDVPRIESRWGEIFLTCPDRPWGPPILLYNGC